MHSNATRAKLSAIKSKGISRIWEHVEKTDTCWLWTGATQQIGYGVIGTGSRIDGSKGCSLTHRVAWELASGQPIPPGAKVLHTCDNRGCVRNDEQGIYTVNGVDYPRFGHLFLATQAENVADMIAKGRNRTVAGEVHPFARLTETQVIKIRERYAAGGITQVRLAEEYGVSQPAISAAITKRKWKSVGD